VIISRYIRNEIIVNICWISLVLFGLVLFSRFNIFLGQAQVGKMSSEIIFIVLALFSPELLSIIFPISVFLGIGFVLTPIYKSRYAVLEASSFSVGKLLYGQKFLLLSIFSFSLFLSLWFSPYAKNEGQKLIDVDNNFAAKIAEPKGLVQIQKDKFNVFGTKSENGYEDLIFINSDDVEKFMYGQSGYIDEQNLVLENGFLYDNENRAISRFNIASVPLRTSTSENYVSLIELFRNLNTENLSELFSRLTIPIFCLFSAIFSLIFSTFSNFLGREKCYLILALVNILYLMFVLSSLGTFSTSLIALYFDYFTVHIVYLLLLLSLFFKRTKRFLGYEGL